MGGKLCLMGMNLPTDLSPEKCWLFISRGGFVPTLL